MDYYGREHQRTVGFLPADELVGSALLGMGKVSLDYGQFSEAVIQFNTLLNGCPDCASAPEAVYLRGVARYKTSHAPSALKEIYQQLLAQYPESEWTKRAHPFTLL
jgi:TolA-binding protein